MTEKKGLIDHFVDKLSIETPNSHSDCAFLVVKVITNGGTLETAMEAYEIGGITGLLRYERELCRWRNRGGEFII